MSSPVLRLRGITKRFGSLVANDGISLDLGRGEVLALLGENGAGKSTLVSILFGHYLADAGSIEVFGAPLPPGQPRAALAALVAAPWHALAAMKRVYGGSRAGRWLRAALVSGAYLATLAVVMAGAALWALLF